MRRLLVPTAAVLLGLGLALWQARMHGDGPPAALPPPARLVPGTLGVASCASAACHHANGDLGTQGSEYSTFAAVDPHSRAYQALFNADSKRIQANLGGGNAHENKLCLLCHGLGADVPKALHGDGTGCEQCHGPAEHWKATHYQRGFDRKTPGFVDLRDPKVRVRSCMKCHVGDGSREVNHDLIAAGHPRLKFEYAAYYANYPRHWAEREKKEREVDPAREARNWLQGQAASVQASLELLASRASREDAPWPEFAEGDCASCHHGLTSPSERQKRTAERAEAARKLGKNIRSGAIPWQTWYTTNLALLKDRAPGKSGDRLGLLLLDIDEEMQQRLPSRERVRKVASEAAALAGAWADAEADPEKKIDKDGVNELIRRIAGNEASVQEGWDGGTQAYLGLSAMNYALNEMGVPRTDLPLKGLREALRGSFPKGTNPLYDSPTGYRSDDVLKLLRGVR